MNIIRFVSLTLLLALNSIVNAQKTLKTTVKYDVEDQELRDILQFQNIAIDNYSFSNAAIKGKAYQVFIQEFKKGKSISRELLFDGTELSQFKIDSDELNFKIFTQQNYGKLKIQLKHLKYSGPSKSFMLFQDSSRYVAKGFFDSNTSHYNSLKTEFPLFAVITPTVHENGSSSYCEVVQSDVKPEELGAHFDIPHYFLITIKFI